VTWAVATRAESRGSARRDDRVVERDSVDAIEEATKPDAQGAAATMNRGRLARCRRSSMR
jgi:hypothetical protein